MKINNQYKISSKRTKGKIFFTTIRKLIGLEVKAIMIIDLDVTRLKGREYRDLLYVGSSRAKHFLQLSIEELEEIRNKDKKEIKSNFELVELNNPVRR